MLLDVTHWAFKVLLHTILSNKHCRSNGKKSKAVTHYSVFKCSSLFGVQGSRTVGVTTMERGSRPRPTKPGPITTNVQNSSTITTIAMKR